VTILPFARSLVDDHEDLRGVWPRAVAFLTRQELERAVARTLQRRAPGAENASARAQLLCLSTYAPDEPARQARYLWGALSRVCHHHPYELAPTAEELRRWIDDVEEVVRRITVD
jgi:hypothetical protein